MSVKFDFDGFSEFEKQLNDLSDNVAKNKDNAEAQLSVDIELIMTNLDPVNSLFSTAFTASTSNDELFNYFAECYQDIMVEGFFEDNYDPKPKFNNIFNPYAKVE